MGSNLTDDRPIFIQIADMLRDSILNGAYEEESQIPSITEISVAYKINPATALKGVNILVDAGLLYKKRGLGMFVSSGARQQLALLRREKFFNDFVCPLVEEAKRLEMSKAETTAMVERGYEKNEY